MRTRAAGLRGAKLRPAAAFSRPKFKISCGIKRQARSRRLSRSVWCRARSVRTGSPQPPLGGGLQLASCGSACASPSARLRACLATEIDLEEVGGPQPPPAEARSSLASLAYLRRLRPENAVRCGVCGVELGRSATGSPQPPPGGGLHPRAARKQARPLGCGPASGCRPGKEKRPIRRPGQAFRNPASVSEKRKNGPSRRRGRSNSGRARINISRRCRNTSDGRPGCRSGSHTTRD